MPPDMPFFAFLLLGLVGLCAPAMAQQDEAVSAWSRSSHSQMRLIAGGRTSDGGYRIGVEISMNAGFKTYWRMPGDAGIPPSFDWSASSNMGSVALRWPAPVRFVDAGVTTLGYKDRVIFPAVVRAVDTAKPTVITLNFDYAVCERICIPAKGSATIRLPDAQETSQTAALNLFRAQTPRTVEPGKNGDQLGLRSAVVVAIGGRKAVEISVSTPAGGKLEDAFLEGPDGWIFGAPELVSTDGEQTVLRLSVEDKPKSIVGVVPIVLTLTGKPQASEVRFDLDFSTPRP